MQSKTHHDDRRRQLVRARALQDAAALYRRAGRPALAEKYATAAAARYSQVKA